MDDCFLACVRVYFLECYVFCEIDDLAVLKWNDFAFIQLSWFSIGWTAMNVVFFIDCEYFILMVFDKRRMIYDIFQTINHGLIQVWKVIWILIKYEKNYNK